MTQRFRMHDRSALPAASRSRRRLIATLASLPAMGGRAGAILTAVLGPPVAHAARDAVAATRGASAPGTRPVVLVLGDSLSAEYGLRRGSGWVELMAQRLATVPGRWQIFNASISGETTAGGRTRLPALLAEQRPRLVIIELGGNDALRGLDLGATRAALDTMVTQAQASGARVLLLGMRMPPNYGRTYGEQFTQMYRDIATGRRCALVPFFLEGVAERIDLFQGDRIHPTEQAQAMLLSNVWPAVQPLLK
jgi:acyl-CoA thioesterase-1